MSGNQNWRTPPELLRAIGVRQWGLDAAADEASAIQVGGFVPPFLGPGSPLAEDALAVSLRELRRKYVAQPPWHSWPTWLNPPYKKPLPWVQWCIANMAYTPAIYLLLHCDPSQGWFDKAVSRARECRLLAGGYVRRPLRSDEGGTEMAWQSGRVAFLDADTGEPVDNNSRGSTLFIFDRNHRGPCHTYLWDWRAAAEARHE